MKGRVRVSLTCVVVVLCAAASAAASSDSAQRVDLSVGYTSPAALRAAVAKLDETTI